MNLYPNSKIYEHFYVARQPIFDKSGNTYGYELLFRNGAHKGVAEINDQDFATMCVATCGFMKSQETIDQSKKIFINFTENLVLEGAPKGLPPTVTVIEILENIVPSKKLLEEIISLKQEGYFVAIDDFEGTHFQNELLDIADIIKVDILGKSFDWIKDIFAKIKSKKALKLAEKVDNREVLELLKALGFDLYQGFFFAKPENLRGRKLQSTQVSKFRILQVIDDPALATEKFVELIAADPSITYRLLRFLNSAAFGFSMKIESVRRAVLLLGSKRLKYWLRMLVMSDLMTEKKTPELYLMALNRGRLLEELAVEGQIKDADPEKMLLFGMLSLIDAMLEIPFDKVISELPLSEEIVTGYLDKNSNFWNYLVLLDALETANTEILEAVCQKTGIRKEAVAQASIRSTVWTNSIANYIV